MKRLDKKELDTNVYEKVENFNIAFGDCGEEVLL